MRYKLLWILLCLPVLSIAGQTSIPGIVAVVNGRNITATELDNAIRKQLHDLDLARYELRLKYLKGLIAEHVLSSGTISTEIRPEEALAKADVKILLESPLPPRFNVEQGDNEIQGNPGAPVTIIEFMDFQSSHSSRVQPVLHQLLEDYGPLVRLIVRDLPLHYHRHAKQAAVAAECAREQGRYWRYHDLLLQKQDKLTSSDLIHHASTLSLDLKQFQACLDDKQASISVQQDVDAAQKLGLSVSPTFFINGLYLKGPSDYANFARLINHELVERGILNQEIVNNLGVGRCPFRIAVKSTLPFSFSGSLLQENPMESSVVLFDQTVKATHTLKPGEALLDGVQIVLVEHDRVYIQHGDQLEYLPQSNFIEEITAEELTPLPAVSTDAVLTLQRSEVDQALEDQEKLTANLVPATFDLEGKRFLKLTEVVRGDFYDLLGLQARDVLMRVDGKWVHEQNNPLWEALLTQKSVSLTIMRKGFPKTFRYVIQDN